MKPILTTVLMAALFAGPSFAGSQIETSEKPPITETGTPGNQSDHHHHHGKMQQALTKLPKEKADMVRQTLDQAREQNKPLMVQAKTLHEQMHDLLKASSFDKAAYTAKQEALRKLHLQIMTNMDDATASYQEKLTSSERLTLADSLYPEHDGEWKDKAK